MASEFSTELTLRHLFLGPIPTGTVVNVSNAYYIQHTLVIELHRIQPNCTIEK